MTQWLGRAIRTVAEAQQKHAMMIEHAFRGQQEFSRRIDQTIRATVEVQRQIEQRVQQMTATLAAMASLGEQVNRMARLITEAMAPYEQTARRIAEALRTAVEREAQARGMTVTEFLEAVRAASEIVEDPEELKQLQTVVAWNAFWANEIGLVDLIRALPPEQRPWPAGMTGILDDDFRPLTSGITTTE